MTAEQEARHINQFDQLRAEAKDEAEAIALYYNTLLQSGLPEELATELTENRHAMRLAMNAALAEQRALTEWISEDE